MRPFLWAGPENSTPGKQCSCENIRPTKSELRGPWIPAQLGGCAFLSFRRILSLFFFRKKSKESDIKNLILKYLKKAHPDFWKTLSRLNKEEISWRHVAMVVKLLDDNKRKRHLKSEFALFQTSSILFNFI